MPEGQGKIDEIYRLSKENNQMLRGMRRSARLHTASKILIYLIFSGFLIWSYIHFVAPILMQMVETLNKIQGASTEAQGQLNSFTESMNAIKGWIPGMASTSAR